jgi:tartrate dehydrogenase/decarboxylase/D-malate dehydrogenase
MIYGDGIGPEVMAEAAKVLEAVNNVSLIELPWGTTRWRATGEMMPDDAIETINTLDGVLLGAVGAPDVPDHLTLWGLLLALRQRLDLWANVRPVRLLPGVPCPLAGVGPGEVDMVFVRENTEGEYAGVGGRAHQHLASEVAIETAVFTRQGVERVVRFAYELATQRRHHLISATKSNASRYGYVLWDEVVSEIGEEFPKVSVESVLVDALAHRLVRDPGSIDVVVASNLFGDILTDLAGAIQGGLGMCASANIAPGTRTPGIFEPVHGSAPDIAGRGIANPCGAIWSAAMLLDHLGTAGGEEILLALEDVCREGARTVDAGGTATTSEVGDAVVEALRQRRK